MLHTESTMPTILLHAESRLTGEKISIFFVFLDRSCRKSHRMNMKRIYEWFIALLCMAAVMVFTAFFEAHFANEEGKYLFVYTTDLMGRFWPFGEWHYGGAPTLNGSGALFLHTFLTQFYYATIGIYIVLAVAFELWLWGWWVYARRAGISALWRSAIVYPLATALFLFAAVSPKFPAGFLWGLIVSLWLCVWSSRRCGLRRKHRPLRKRTWRAYLSGAFILASMGFYPFLLFLVGYSILYWVGSERTVCGNTTAHQDNTDNCAHSTDLNHRQDEPNPTQDLVTTHTEFTFFGRKWHRERQTQADKAYSPLWFALLALYWLCLPFVWAAVSHQSLANACQLHVITQWKNNGISKDWKLYNCYQKTWRAIRQNNYQEALEHANSYWFTERAVGSPSTHFSPGEQYFRHQLAECTKLALLASGELNNRFLTYNVFLEMAYLFQPTTPMVAFYNPIYLRFYWETGHLTGCVFEGVNITEREGLRADVLPLLALSQVCLEQYGLADKYLYLLRHTLFYRQEAEKMALLNRPLNGTWNQADPYLRATLQRKRADISPLPFSSRGKDPQSEMTNLFAVHPHNFCVAEYVLMKHLLNKDLSKVYEVLKRYRKLGYTAQELPLYAQEALLLFIEYGYRPEADEVIKTGLDGLETFRFNPGIIQRFENFLRDQNEFEAGRMLSDTFYERYGNSYAFFFKYLTIIEDYPQAAATSSPIN